MYLLPTLQQTTSHQLQNILVMHSLQRVLAPGVLLRLPPGASRSNTESGVPDQSISVEQEDAQTAATRGAQNAPR